MTLIASDTFVGPAGTSRATRSGQIGAILLPAPWTAAATATLDGNGHLQPTSQFECDLQFSGTSASGNYAISTTAVITGTIAGQAYIEARGQRTGAFNVYQFGITPSGVQLSKWIAGAQTQLVSPVNVALAAGSYPVTYALNGSSHSVTLQRASDGKYLTSAGAWQSAATACITATDSTLTNGAFGLGWYCNNAAGAGINCVWGATTVVDDGAGVTPTPTLNVIWHGDSLTYGTNATHAGTLLATRLATVVNALGTTATYAMLGVPGQTIEQMIGQVSTLVGLMDPTKLNVVVAQGGHNSYDAGDSPATVESLIGAYAANLSAAALAAGCPLRLVWTTELPAAYPGYPANFDALRDVSNGWLRSNYRAAGINALSDVAGDPLLGPDGAESNATYFSASDHTHLTDAGYTIWGGYDLAAVQTASAYFSVHPATSGVGQVLAVGVAGTGTRFAGTPFTLSGGSGASIAGQAVAGSTSATLTILTGTAAGVLTLTDQGSGATAAITVTAPTASDAVAIRPNGTFDSGQVPVGTAAGTWTRLCRLPALGGRVIATVVVGPAAITSLRLLQSSQVDDAAPVVVAAGTALNAATAEVPYVAPGPLSFPLAAGATFEFAFGGDAQELMVEAAQAAAAGGWVRVYGTLVNRERV